MKTMFTATQLTTIRVIIAALTVSSLAVITASTHGQQVQGVANPFPIVTPTPFSPTALIQSKYASMGGATGVLGSTTTAIGHTADLKVYFQHFQNGAIYWTSATSVHETHGDIWRKFQALGGTGILGYPSTDESNAPCGGRFSNFKKGEATTSVYWKSGIGAFEVHGLIREKHLEKGGVCVLGYPTTDETATSVNPTGRYNHFSNGYSIYWKSETGAHEVQGAIRDKYLALGGPDKFLGFPQTDQTVLESSSGRYNHFEGGSIYWTSLTGAHEVHGAIRDKWASLGWERSWLGYPMSDENIVPNFTDPDFGIAGRFSKFQKGTIYYYPDSGAVEVNDLAEIFESRQKASALRKVAGKRKLLTILYNPIVTPLQIDPECENKKTCDHGNYVLQLPTKEEVESTLFGTKNGSPIPSAPGQPKASVSDFYRENSSGRVELVNAGILGPYVAPFDKRLGHYWDDSKHRWGSNDGWLSGHSERNADAIRMAEAQGFDFKKYDLNDDDKLTPDELAIIVVCPQIGKNSEDDWGDVVRAIGGYDINFLSATPRDLTVGGVTISGEQDMEIFEWFAHDPDPINLQLLSLGLPAHELGHLLTGIPDLYGTGWKYDSGVFSRMGAGKSSREITHLDPFHKLKAGWLNYTVALGSGTYTLRNVEGYGEALILYNQERGRSEYFILEYRNPGTSYDAGRQNTSGGIPNTPYNQPNAGLAVWHVVEDESAQKELNPSDGWNWYRKSVLLIRANGGTSLDDSRALFTTRTSPLALWWSNGKRVEFNIQPLDPTDLGAPPYAMRLLITVNH